MRILSSWKNDPPADIVYDHVFVPPVSPTDLIVDAFRPIVRDGASSIEVQLRVHKALDALAAFAPDVFSVPASDMAADARIRARDAMTGSDYLLLEEVPQLEGD